MTKFESEPGAVPRPLYAHVVRRVSALYRGYSEGVSASVSALARLRRGVGREPGADLDLIELTFSNLESVSAGLPEEPTLNERAAFTAICLYALHQQSRPEQSMHRSGYSLGRSARELSRAASGQGNGELDPGVTRRFVALGTAESWEETVHHARGLIQQFRAARIPLDYGRLAEDLVALQNPSTVSAVRTVWGRDFYLASRAPEVSENTPS